MALDEFAPVVDSFLHADGSVKTMAGDTILPADPERAAEYLRRAAIADKLLCEDGSVIDRAGNVILGPDEGRARDYASRTALAVYSSEAGGEPGTGGGGSTAPPLFNITDAANVVLS